MKQFYNRCKIQTPIIYAKQLLDQVSYLENLFGKRILEPSFGKGNILAEIVYRYIEDAQFQNIPKNEIIFGLENDIIGYEIDSKSFFQTIDRLNKLVDQYGIKYVKWNLQNQDFLKAKVHKVDFIVGNPPYITYHDLPIEQRASLREKYQSCRIGRFDYYYAFIERSLLWLNKNGKMVYLVPYSILTNKFAKSLRTLLAINMVEIIDYRNIDVFSKVMCTPISLFFHNNKDNHEKIIYKKEKLQKDEMLSRNEFINNDRENNNEINCFANLNISLENKFRVVNSIATLKNRVFIFQPDKQDRDYYYIDKYKIEKSVTKTAVSAKSLRYHRNMKIIFPYRNVEGKFIPYEEMNFATKYPNTYQYLLDHKKILLDRKMQKGSYWYEYGRRQALDCVALSKIIMPNIITKQNHAYVVSNDTVPYAGICIVAKENNDDLNKLKSILESKNFLNFLLSRGTPTKGMSYRISVNDIKNYLMAKK